MTTIAAKFSTLEIAADSRISDDNSFYTASKLRLRKGSIYGGCGEWATVLKAFDLVHKRIKKWDADVDVEVLELKKTGIYIYQGTAIPTKIRNDVWAVGSGASYFLGAYAACGDFKRAMEIACELDPASGCPIDYYILGADNGKSKSNK